MDTITAALERADCLRRSPAPHGGAGGHKEWWHFCVYGPGFDVLVNFSLVDDVRPAVEGGAEQARLTMLVRRGGAWDGDVDDFASGEVEIGSDGLSARFGASLVRLDAGAYRLRAALRERPLRVDLVLRPRTMPSLANNIRLDAGPPIHWLVVPRLVADGELFIGGERLRIAGALGYHDHNWGHFAWGRDFAWEWGFGLPSDARNPWSLVFVRLSDRFHTRSYMQAVFLWRGPRQHRVFRAWEVAVRREGFLRPDRICKIPRIMGLLSPWGTTDVPATLEIGASDGDDHLECRFEGEEVGQVVIPNDNDPGLTIINEVAGRLQARGSIRGETVALDGGAVFEFLGA